jgi:hypothetical protein
VEVSPPTPAHGSALLEPPPAFAGENHATLASAQAAVSAAADDFDSIAIRSDDVAVVPSTAAIASSSSSLDDSFSLFDMSPADIARRKTDVDSAHELI